jgi:hypothetical protein
MMRFAPQKALNAVVQLQVERGEGGPCWLYDVHLVVSCKDVLPQRHPSHVARGREFMLTSGVVGKHTVCY